MKKLILGCLLCSVGTYAEETHELPPIQGWWPDTQSFSSLVSGVAQPQVMNGMIAYGTNWSMVSHAQMAAAQAAGKQAAKKACLKDSQEKYNNASSDAIQRMAVSVADCHFSLSHEPDSMAACSKQASDHYDAGMVGIDDDKDLRDEYCAKTYGN